MVKKWMCKLLMAAVVLGSWKGYLAIYNYGDPEPRQIFPTEVASLPPADQEALETGILIRNDRDLQQLLEAYLS